jgi:hypothetical protein
VTLEQQGLGPIITDCAAIFIFQLFSSKEPEIEAKLLVLEAKAGTVCP